MIPNLRIPLLTAFLILIAFLLAARTAEAQSPAVPDTYSMLANSEMGGKRVIKINRNGPKEVIELTADSYHLRHWYDFQAHKVYTLDFGVNRCTVQEYASPYAPVWFDPIGGSADLMKEMAASSQAPKIIRKETVNGISAKVAEAVFPEGKFVYWLDEKYGFMVKQNAAVAKRPEQTVFEVTQLAYAPSPAGIFTPPPGCTPVRGVQTANGGHSESTVEANVSAETDLKTGQTRSTASVKSAPVPAAAKGKITGVKYRLDPPSYNGPCPHGVKLIADITTDGPLTAWYAFLSGAVRARGPRESTVTFTSAGTKTIVLDAEYVMTPQVATSFLAAIADENGRHGPETVGSGEVRYNATCSAAPRAK